MERDDYTFILEIDNDETPNKKYQDRLLQIVTFCYVFAANSPFIIGDIYYSVADISCQDDQNTGIGLSLGSWLKISGVSHLIIIMLLFIKNTKIFNLIIFLPDLVWSILGFVMFVGFLEPSGTCSYSINTYMWFRILMGTIIRTSTIYFI